MYPIIRQKKIIVDLALGKISGYPDVENLSDEYHTIAKILLDTPLKDRLDRFNSLALLNKTLVDDIIHDNLSNEYIVKGKYHRTTNQIPDDFPVALVPSFVFWNHISTFTAHAGIGKSSLMLSAICDFVMGQKMFYDNIPQNPSGIPLKKEEGLVLILDGENFLQGQKQRLSWWVKAGLYPYEVGDSIHWFELPNGDFLDLNDTEIQKKLLSVVDDLCFNLGKPLWLVVDSWNGTVIDNTYNRQILPVIQFIEELLRSYNMAITLVHHPDKKNAQNIERNKPLPLEAASGASLLGQRNRTTFNIHFAPRPNNVIKITDPRIVTLTKENMGAMTDMSKFVVTFESLAGEYGLPLNAYYLKYHGKEFLDEWTQLMLDEAPINELPLYQQCAFWIMNDIEFGDDGLTRKEIIAMGEDDSELKNGLDVVFKSHTVSEALRSLVKDNKLKQDGKRGGTYKIC